MKKTDRGEKLRRRHLTEEDEALWRNLATSVEPLKRKGRVPATASADPETPGSRHAHPLQKHASHHTHHGSGGHYTASLPHAGTPQPLRTRSDDAPQLASFDKRRARKMRSGREEIERRIDLHGMSQREAHSVLRHFLFECHAQGRRSVLVITGKGAPRRRTEDDLAGWAEPEPGVLKRQVPRWLAEPELRAIVVSYTTAASHHGGEGALYVHLRRRREG